jgi:hypothetical protein
MNKRVIRSAVAGVMGLSTCAFAQDPTASELREQIEALNAKVQRIEAAEAAEAQTRATSAGVMEDAVRRSQLLQSGAVTAGYDGKEFFLGSADGNFKVVPIFQLQIRNNTNWNEDGKDSGGDDLDNGFEIRRAKAGLKGNAFSKNLKYELRWAFARSGGAPVLELANIGYAFNETWGFRIGQFKDPTIREENVSSGRQLAVDRSLLNELLGGGQTDYVQGVTLLYNNGDNFRAELGYIDGANTDNTDYTDGGGGPAIAEVDPSWGALARAEYKVFGDWKNYDDFSMLKVKENLLVIGAGANFTEGGDSSILFHTVDAQYKNAGLPFGVYAAYVGNQIDGDDSGYNWGALLQGSYMINDKLEVFARYDYTDIDSAEDQYSEITVGGNYFFAGHNAKATIDVGFLPDGSPTSESGIGVKEGDDFQFVVRGQFQLAF